MKHPSRQLTFCALGIALVCISTRIFQFPIPLGYAHLGNCVILLFAVFFDPWVGAISAGVGSALADLLSFPAWTLPTLIIKTLMGYAVAKIAGNVHNLRSLRTLFAVIVGILIMVLGYFIAGSILYGSIVTGAAQIPGLTLEGIVGIILFYVIGSALVASGVLKKL